MELKGVAASPGKAACKLLLVREPPDYDQEELAQVPEQENLRQFRDCVKQLYQEMQATVERLMERGEDVKATMAEMHAALMTDKLFVSGVEKEIRAGYSAAAAVARASAAQQNILLALGDSMMAERAQDVKDMSRRLICRLTGQTYPDLTSLREDVIIVSEDLLPSMLTSANEHVKGLVMAKGSKTSHVAILAANMEIPAVLGCGDVEGVPNGEFAFLDAQKGALTYELSGEEQRRAVEAAETYHQKMRELTRFKALAGITRDGKQIQVLGNIMDASVTDRLLGYGADGVGLFRTEFLYMNREKLPKEDEQFVIYRNIAKKLAGKPLTIRTMDIGADKVAASLNLEQEENPFLGYRAIRICVDRPEILKVQLAAALRASAFGKIKIMFPMVTSLDELDTVLNLFEEVKNQFRREKVPFDESIQTGIMVEVPSAAVLADQFVKKADFFSIGSNDLTQYTLAADRLNQKISYLYNHLHPAVLRLIYKTISAASRAGKSCSVCGEMAADPIALPILIGLGLEKVSVNPPSVLPVKNFLSLLDVSRCEALARQTLDARTPAEVRDLVLAAVPEEYITWCS